jgi:hypothetical protein
MVPAIKSACTVLLLAKVKLALLRISSIKLVFPDTFKVDGVDQEHLRIVTYRIYNTGDLAVGFFAHPAIDGVFGIRVGKIKRLLLWPGSCWYWFR